MQSVVDKMQSVVERKIQSDLKTKEHDHSRAQTFQANTKHKTDTKTDTNTKMDRESDPELEPEQDPELDPELDRENQNIGFINNFIDTGKSGWVVAAGLFFIPSVYAVVTGCLTLVGLHTILMSDRTYELYDFLNSALTVHVVQPIRSKLCRQKNMQKMSKK